MRKPKYVYFVSYILNNNSQGNLEWWSDRPIKVNKQIQEIVDQLKKHHKVTGAAVVNYQLLHSRRRAKQNSR